MLLKREGWNVNAKRVYRLYKEEGLIVRTKQRKKLARRARVTVAVASAPNQHWSMDFVQARLVDGRWFRVLTVVDQFTRECVLLYADLSISGAKVTEALTLVVRQITCDNGTEFASKALDVWAWQQSIQLIFITPGRPVENSYIESFHGRLRDEFLNVNLFFSLTDVRQQLKSWQRDYNLIRPHSALADRTLSEFAASWKRASFALPIVNKAGTTARPGSPDGTLPRGLGPDLPA